VGIHVYRKASVWHSSREWPLKASGNTSQETEFYRRDRERALEHVVIGVPNRKDWPHVVRVHGPDTAPLRDNWAGGCGYGSNRGNRRVAVRITSFLLISTFRVILSTPHLCFWVVGVVGNSNCVLQPFR
jgi:hypothetical protein